MKNQVHQVMKKMLRGMEGARQPERMSALLMEAVCSLVPLEACGVYLLNEKSQLEAFYEKNMEKEIRAEINRHWSLRRLKNLAEGERVRVLDPVEFPGDHHFLAASLVSAGECVGIVEGLLGSLEQSVAREVLEDVGMLCAAASGLVWSRILYARGEERTRHLLSLNHIFSDFAPDKSPGVQLQLLLEKLLLELDLQCVCLQERPAGRRFAALTREIAEKDSHFKLPEGIAEQVFQSQFPMLAVAGGPGNFGRTLQEKGLGAVLATPVVSGSKRLGVLAVGAQDSGLLLSEAMADSLSGVAGIAAILLQLPAS